MPNISGDASNAGGFGPARTLIVRPRLRDTNRFDNRLHRVNGASALPRGKDGITGATARRSFYQQPLAEFTGEHKLRWSVMLEDVLHPDDRLATTEPSEARRLCSSFSRLFFAQNLRRIWEVVQLRLASTARCSGVHRMTRSAVLMHDFCSVVVDEVTQLIRRLPPKSSLLNSMPITSQVVKGRDGAAGEPLQLQESFRRAVMATCQTANSLYKVGMLDFKAKHSLLLHSRRYGILKSLGYH